MPRPSLAFAPPPRMAIAAGATAPDPGGAGAPCWSTLEERVLVWSGSEWVAQAEFPDIQRADANYVHVQGVASDVWVVVHNLNKLPSIMVIDSAGDEVRGDTRHDSLNQATLTFATPFSGQAVCN